MKNLLRLFIFIFASVKLTQYVIGGFYFSHSSGFLLYVLGLFVLYFFMRPLLRLVGLPSGGVGFLFMVFLLTLITTHAFTLFISTFSLTDTVVSELIIFGFVLPSKQLTAFWANVFSSLMITVFMWFFAWLCEPHK